MSEAMVLRPNDASLSMSMMRITKYCLTFCTSAILTACGAAHYVDDQQNAVSPSFSSDLNPEWILVWSDEFEGETLDRTKWVPETSCWGGGNNEKQCYTDRPENIEVKNGVLTLIAQSESFTDFAMPQDFEDRGHQITQSYTSGKVRTKDLASWTYGRFEARLKFPQGQGTWPAFWMMPEEDYYGGWPLSGEIDIAEAVNLGANCYDCAATDSENRSIAALHFGEAWPENKFKSMKAVLDNPTGFNVFVLEWSEHKIDWFVNDELIFTLTSDEWFTSSVAKEENPTAPFDRPFYLMFNLAVGGDLSLQNNEKTFDTNAFPNQLIIDWVRVYERQK